MRHIILIIWFTRGHITMISCNLERGPMNQYDTEKTNWKWNWMWEDKSEHRSALRVAQAIPSIVALPVRKLSLPALYFLPGVTKWLSKAQDVMRAVYPHGREREGLEWNSVCCLMKREDWRFGLSGHDGRSQGRQGQKHLKLPWEGNGRGWVSRELLIVFGECYHFGFYIFID